MIGISTHAFTEGDRLMANDVYFTYRFQLTPSRKATKKRKKVIRMREISTHAFTEGDSIVEYHLLFGYISTHAFTEGDTVWSGTIYQFDPISTHAFTEGDDEELDGISDEWVFQLTPSRKATMSTLQESLRSGNFNSRLHGRRHSTGVPSLTRQPYFNSRLHGRRLQIQIIFAAKHFLFLLILSKFLILAFLFHLASLRFSLHPVIFPVRISLYFSVYLPFALETCTLCHNI